MTSTPANAPPTRVHLIPVRAFHIDQGQGRTVAVLFRVAVDDHRASTGRGNKQACNQQARPGIGVRT